MYPVLDFDILGNMETSQAVRALASLAQETRLGVFRLLIARGPDGMAAGDIAAALDVPAPTLSFHLNHLANADLIAARRDGRSILYAVRPAGVQALVRYLVDDCCQGRPALCGLPESACCPPKAKRGGRSRIA